MAQTSLDGGNFAGSNGVFVVAGYWVLERLSHLFPACKYLIASRNPIFFKNRISPFEPKVLRDLCVPTKPKIPLAPAKNIPQFVLLDID